MPWLNTITVYTKFFTPSLNLKSTLPENCNNQTNSLSTNDLKSLKYSESL